MTDEQVLIGRAQLGDMEAFRELVELAKVNVYRLAYDLTGNPHDAEDLSQEVFLKAFRSLPGFRGEAKWSTWLYRITVNASYDQRKKTPRGLMVYRNNIAEDDAPLEYPDHRSDRPDRSAESSLIQEHIENALGRLKPQERSVFVLRHYHDLPLKQIAEMMSIAEGTVKSYLFRAVHRLQQELAFYKKEIGMGERE